jgi:type IV secretory pathway TrbL component
MFAPSFWDHLSDRLELAVYDTNAEYRASLMDPALDQEGNHPVADKVNKFSTLAQRYKKFHANASTGADEVNAMLDVAEPMVDQAVTATKASVGDMKTSVQEVLDALKDLPGSNGAPLSGQ